MTLQLKAIDKDAAAIDTVYEILKRCGENMYTNLKLEHWYPYIAKETFIASLNNKQLYGVYEDNNAVATFNVSIQPRNYYHDDFWNVPANKALYLGQLATDPAHQGKGIGKWCMKRIEQIAQDEECSVIRFDGLLMHPWLKSFYESVGYKSCKIVTPGKWELLCFDKAI